MCVRRAVLRAQPKGQALESELEHGLDDTTELRVVCSGLGLLRQIEDRGDNCEVTHLQLESCFPGDFGSCGVSTRLVDYIIRSSEGNCKSVLAIDYFVPLESNHPRRSVIDSYAVVVRESIASTDRWDEASFVWLPETVDSEIVRINSYPWSG